MCTDQISPALLKRITFIVVLIALCQVSSAQSPYGQEPFNQAQATAKSRPQVNDSVSRRRKPELSELAEDNYSHVAASSAQIREVLLIDAGLLVELKRWIAKEATDEGRIVEDQSLADQAVFDRLDRFAIDRYRLFAPNRDLGRVV